MTKDAYSAIRSAAIAASLPIEGGFSFPHSANGHAPHESGNRLLVDVSWADPKETVVFTSLPSVNQPNGKTAKTKIDPTEVCSDEFLKTVNVGNMDEASRAPATVRRKYILRQPTTQARTAPQTNGNGKAALTSTMWETAFHDQRDIPEGLSAPTLDHAEQLRTTSPISPNGIATNTLRADTFFSGVTSEEEFQKAIEKFQKALAAARDGNVAPYFSGMEACLNAGGNSDTYLNYRIFGFEHDDALSLTLFDEGKLPKVDFATSSPVQANEQKPTVFHMYFPDEPAAPYPPPVYDQSLPQADTNPKH